MKVGKIFLSVGLTFFLAATFGCIAGGPHLSIYRDDGSSTKEPFSPSSILSQDIRMLSPGAGESSSEKFENYGGIQFVFGGYSKGDVYRTATSAVSIGYRKLEKEEAEK